MDDPVEPRRAGDESLLYHHPYAFHYTSTSIPSALLSFLIRSEPYVRIPDDDDVFSDVGV